MKYTITTSKGNHIVNADRFSVSVEGFLYLHRGETLVAAFREWVGIQERRVQVENNGA